MVVFQASLGPVLLTSMTKLPHCPRFIVAGPVFVTTSAGAAGSVTVSRVGSPTAGVSGSSEGESTIPLAAGVAETGLGVTAPPGTFGFMTTSNVMVATLAGLVDGSAGIVPGVGLAGEWISMPLTSGDTPATSATAAPFRVVLPAT